MKKILAAIDFSDITTQVIEQAESLARAFSAHLSLIHVAAPDPDFVGLDAGPQVVRDDRARELRTERQALQQMAERLQGRGIQADAHLVEGPTVQTIIEQADHLHADLLILGSHGHGAWYRALVGSVAEGVLRKATCPLLVIPVSRSETEKS